MYHLMDQLRGLEWGRKMGEEGGKRRGGIGWGEGEKEHKGEKGEEEGRRGEKGGGGGKEGREEEEGKEERKAQKEENGEGRAVSLSALF